MIDARLRADKDALPELLAEASAQAVDFLRSLPERPAAAPPVDLGPVTLPERGVGAAAALRDFRARIEPHLSGSAGPRYFGLVTGGSTPAAVAADWLVSAYDQNVSNSVGSAAAGVEAQALDMLRQLFDLPPEFAGVLVTGGTMANFVGLAAGRQWAGEAMGVDVAEEGVGAAPDIAVFAATPHASAVKALAMLGMGRRRVRRVPTLPGREAMDAAALRAALAAHGGKPSIVLASACTVNTADFDDVQTVAEIARAHNAWLHVDAAFGLFARVSPHFAALVQGVELADSIAADGHKWLNVPYDCGFTFCRHLDVQERVFRVSAPYLSQLGGAAPDYLNRGPENSQRFRALPVWMTLMAYGRGGYREIVERNCRVAATLGAWLDASPLFELLAPVRLNIACFRLSDAALQGQARDVATARFVDRLHQDGVVFLTPTTYGGGPAIRAAVSNWSTTDVDLPIVTDALVRALRD
ncbi:MAG: pyridoxal-dependent decarboxylase [Anaerolineae bacterium]